MIDPTSQIRSLRDVASRINAGSDLDDVMRHLIRAACEHGGWALGSIMAIDAENGQAYVVVRYDPTLLPRSVANKWELATSPTLIALHRNEPVYIRDARESAEFPGYRRDAVERGYRTVLVLPMSCFDSEGRPMALNVFSRQIKDVSPDDLAFMGMIVHLGGIAVEREHQLRKERQASERMQEALQAQTTLLQQVLSGGSTNSLAAMLGGMLSDPLLVADFAANELIASRAPTNLELDDETWRKLLDGDDGSRILAAARQTAAAGGEEIRGLRLDGLKGGAAVSARLEALTVDGQTVGALLIFRQSVQAGSDLERLLLDSIKFALSVQMMRSVIRFRFETRTLTEIFFEIVERRWRDTDDLIQRGRRLGLPLGRPLRMMVVDFPSETSLPTDIGLDAYHLVARLIRGLNLQASVVTVGSGLVCMIQEEGGREKAIRMARRLVDGLRQAYHIEPLVVSGGVCERLDSYPDEWERCWRMIRIARSFGRSGVLSSLDFGPMPMLIGASDSGDVRGFVEGAIGAVTAHDREHGTSYLTTLAAYLREGGRAQACANAMGLHVTTLRYRLSRIEDLFHIKLETPDERFAIELAIRLHAIIGGSNSA